MARSLDGSTRDSRCTGADGTTEDVQGAERLARYLTHGPLPLDVVEKVEGGRLRVRTPLERVGGRRFEIVAEENASAERNEAERDSTVLQEVRDALLRIEADVFGMCVADGQPIETERLEASPRVRRGLKHQTLLEAPNRHRFPTM